MTKRDTMKLKFGKTDHIELRGAVQEVYMSVCHECEQTHNVHALCKESNHHVLRGFGPDWICDICLGEKGGSAVLLPKWRKTLMIEDFLSGWQKLESAPRDATTVELLLKGGQVAQGHWAENLSGEEQPPFRGWFTRSNDHSYIEVRPIRWRPIPNTKGLE